MKIEKIVNNNIVISFNEQNKEVIAVGRGLGFQKKSGDIILDNKIEKIYVISDTGTRSAKL